MNQAVASQETEAEVSDGKIICHIDNVRVHSVQAHIKTAHENTWTLERYQSEFPDMPILSDFAKDLLARKAQEKAVALKASAAAAAGVTANTSGGEKMMQSTILTSLAQFHEVFELGTAPAAMSGAGNPISIEVMSGHDLESLDYVPDIDSGYVYEIDLLKKVIIGFALNMPTYLWGMHGTGKTSVLQQAAARTKRPFIRVQHTINMQESEVLGQWTVRDGATQFQMGPLPQAMIMGWVYCADEYDMAMPSVVAVYQPVLEGQALLVKDAPPHLRKIIPHPNFRFVATGNTNGIGDETGLYQGTLVQNAANYSRFKITEEVKYMNEKMEENILCLKLAIDRKDAKKIIKFGVTVRQMFADQKISMVVSTRELLSAVELGVAYGGNWPLGLELAFANRLSRVDRAVVKEYMQRVFTV